MNDPVSKTQIEIDVAVLAPAEPGRPQRILSLGEVSCTLACYSATGFTHDLRSAADSRLRLIGLEDIYRP